MLERLVAECARVSPPVCVSFSGGRTSGMLVWGFLQAYSARRDDLTIVFANTGREMPQTLDFVHAIDQRWQAGLVWVERAEGGLARVDYDTAARNGEPYESLIIDKQFLPNVLNRMCTRNLKVDPIRNWCRDVLGWRHWSLALGIRADEPRRAYRLLHCAGRTRERYKYALPLWHAQISVDDVLSFWRDQPFDLQIPVDRTKRAVLGNCDLCFLKRVSDLRMIARQFPERADWWVRQEARCPGRTFSKDFDYRTLASAVSQDDQELTEIECHCTD